MTGDEDDVGVRLRDTRRNRADSRRTDKLHADARFRVDLLKIVNELGEILD